MAKPSKSCILLLLNQDSGQEAARVVDGLLKGVVSCLVFDSHCVQ